MTREELERIKSVVNGQGQTRLFSKYSGGDTPSGRFENSDFEQAVEIHLEAQTKLLIALVESQLEE